MTDADDVLFFNHEGNRLAYYKVGYGPATLVAFHGFGQSGRVFQPLDETIGHRFTVFAVDLFFHGNSQYTSRQLLTKTDWQRLIGAFLDGQGVDRFSLMGFSLGGRFALATAEAFASQLDQLILIAPDGVTRTSWYWAATTTRLGRWLFRHGLRHLSVFTQPNGNALCRTVARYSATTQAGRHCLDAVSADNPNHKRDQRTAQSTCGADAVLYGRV